MLGKTHMAIGALGAIIATPLLLHTHWIAIPQAISHIALIHGHPVMPKGIAREIEWETAAIVSSIMPDFDEQNSLMARRAEGTVQITLVISLVLVLWLMKLTLSPLSWAFVIILSLGLITRANLMRRIALGALGGAALLGGVTGNLPTVCGFLFAAWSVGAMFTAHRTFTHSLLGWGIFSYASTLALTHFHLSFLGSAVALGYLLHIVADIPSGGVSLLWPLPILMLFGKKDLKSPRIGIRLIQTGGIVDHSIGALAAAIFVLLIVVPSNLIHL